MQRNVQKRTPVVQGDALHAYQAIWFDAGDTLITIPETHKLFSTYLADRSIAVSEERIIEALNVAFNQVYYAHQPDEYAACTPESDRQFWLVFYRFVLDRLELLRQLDESVAHQMCHELYELYTSPDHYQVFDDVVPVLQTLRERGFQLAVISNFAPTLLHILEDKQLADYFSPIVVSTLAGFEKPDPRIFRHTLELTELKPEQVLYIGDHEINDVWAPAQAGIDALRIKRYDYQQGEGITSLYEILER